VLLAAGRGERLRPLTDEIPKCLVPINGRPLIDYWLYNLSASGVERFLVNLHYRRDMVRRYLESGPFASRIEFAHEPSLLGTGGTLLANRGFLQAGPTLVAHVDNLCQCDFGAFAAFHRERPAGTELTVMTFHAPDPRACGIVETDHGGIVTAFHEKVADPPGDLASAAVFIVEPSIVDELNGLGREVVDLSRDILPRMVGRMAAWHNDEYHRDIGTPQAWLAAQLDFPGDGREVGPGRYWVRLWRTPHTARALRVLKAVMTISGARKQSRPEPDETERAPALVVRDRFNRSDVRLLKERANPKRTLVLYWHVPPSFRSAWLYAEAGIRSVAMCASQTR
jgi:mannose-1-phosphate guanylyltransferase